MFKFVTTRAHQTPTKQAYIYALIVILFRNINADIRVRIDGVEDNHGIIKVDKNGKVRETIARLFETLYSNAYFIGMRAQFQHP